MYTKDIADDMSVNCDYVQYADDTMVCVSDPDPKTVVTRLSKKIETICTSFNANQLYLNESKTEFILLAPKTTKQVDIPLCFSSHGSDFIIPQSTHTKYLGCVLDNALSWDFEIASKRKTLFAVVYSIRKIFPLLNNKI